MDRPELLVHARIRQQLGDGIIQQVLGHLAPGDCQTCNRPLGPDPVALEAEQLGPMWFVRLHPHTTEFADGATSAPISNSAGMKWLELCRRLFTRQQRIVHRVLARAVLAGQGGRVVQSVRSRGAE